MQLFFAPPHSSWVISTRALSHTFFLSLSLASFSLVPLHEAPSHPQRGLFYSSRRSLLIGLLSRGGPRRGSPPSDPCSGLPSVVRHRRRRTEKKNGGRKKKVGGVSQRRVIPGFISAGVLCALEQCVTTSRAQAGTPGLTSTARHQQSSLTRRHDFTAPALIDAFPPSVLQSLQPNSVKGSVLGYRCSVVVVFFFFVCLQRGSE